MWCYVMMGDEVRRSLLFLSALSQEPVGPHPSPRVAPALAPIGTVLYLFGGRQGIEMGEGALDELWRVDVSKPTLEWEKVEVATGPMARSFHQMVSTYLSMVNSCLPLPPSLSCRFHLFFYGIRSPTRASFTCLGGVVRQAVSRICGALTRPPPRGRRSALLLPGPRDEGGLLWLCWKVRHYCYHEY